MHVPNTEDYINLTNTKCQLCNTTASYVLKGTKQKLYCLRHLPNKDDYEYYNQKR